MNRPLHSAPIDGESWLRIVGVVVIAFVVVEFEKWIRFGRHRDTAKKCKVFDLAPSAIT